MTSTVSPVAKLWSLVQEEKSDITAIYFFAILSGLIQLSVPVGIQAIIGFVLGGTLSASLVVLITVLVAAVLLTGLMQVSQMNVVEKIQQRIFVRYAFAFADRLPRLDLKKVDAFYLPELVNRFFDIMTLQKSFAKLLLDLPAAAIQILFGLMLLSFYHPFFILFGMLLLFLLWLILYITAGKGLQSSLAESTHKYGVAGWLEEMARLVKSFKFSNSGLHLRKADEKTVDYLQARTTHFEILKLKYKVLVAFKVLITAAMLIGGVALLLNQQINIGQFVAAEIIIITVIASIEKIIVNLDSIYDVLTAVEKIAKLTDKPVESSGSYLLPASSSIAVTAQGLRFGYNTEKQVIKGLNFSLAAGEKLCINGRDGAGKSTLLKLLAGVYNDFEGQLLMNGVPLRNYDLPSLRERMGILFPQENVFNGTLWENLTMGRVGIDREYVNRLCQQTGLQPFLASLPHGYDTPLDPAGKRLAQNVIQKILLVRALASKPALLVMDEPWQGIDDPYRTAIQQLLLSMKETTAIVATNDEGFAKACDQTLKLER